MTDEHVRVTWASFLRAGSVGSQRVTGRIKRDDHDPSSLLCSWVGHDTVTYDASAAHATLVRLVLARDETWGIE